jgi:hypothetical protein
LTTSNIPRRTKVSAQSDTPIAGAGPVAASARCAAHQRGQHRVAGREPRRHHRELQRRRLQVALADTDHQGLALVPAVAERGELPGPVGHEASALARQIDAEAGAEAEPARHGRDRVDPDLAGELIKIDVAGLRQGVDQRKRTVPAALPAMKGVAAEAQMTGTADLEVRRGDPSLERGQGDDHLEGRARRILPGDRLVHQRCARVGGESAPDVPTQAVAEGGRIERRHRGERQDLAAVHIEHHGAGALLLGKAPVDMALQLEVDGQAEVRTGLALLPVELLDLAAERVDLVAADAGAAAQHRLIDLLDAILADPELRQLEEGIPIELALRDRTDIAHDMRRDLAQRIVAQQAGIERYARQLRRMDGDPR